MAVRVPGQHCEACPRMRAGQLQKGIAKRDIAEVRKKLSARLLSFILCGLCKWRDVRQDDDVVGQLDGRGHGFRNDAG